MVKNLSAYIMGVHAAKLLNRYDMEKVHRPELCQLVHYKLMVVEKVYP